MATAERGREKHYHRQHPASLQGVTSMSHLTSIRALTQANLERIGQSPKAMKEVMTRASTISGRARERILLRLLLLLLPMWTIPRQMADAGAAQNLQFKCIIKSKHEYEKEKQKKRVWGGGNIYIR